MKRSGPPQRRTPLAPGAPLKRSTLTANRNPLKRTRMKSKPMKRDWTDAEAKKRAEGKCRYCGATGVVQSAHVIGREHDEPRWIDQPDVLYVHPDDVVPLCREHHDLYDARQLDILSVLTRAEQARAVLHVGLMRALKRICGGTVFLNAMPS